MTPETLRLHLLQLRLTHHLKTVVSYRASLRAAVRGFWNGTLDFEGFFAAFETAIRLNFPRAWAEGMQKVGLDFSEITREEQLKLDEAIINERNYIFPFGVEIEENTKEKGGALTPLFLRVEKWLPRYMALVSLAMQMAQSDPKLMWVRNAKDSCRSCVRLNGQVRRASVWSRYQLRPQAPSLECMRKARGVPVCRCEFHPTDAPLSRGRLPGI